jgi:hypothetical protein
MPKYPKAKPFDIIQTIKDLQAAVKALQVRFPGANGPWQQATLVNGWTGNLNYRLTRDNEVQLSAFELAPGTLTNGTMIANIPLLPAGNHLFPGAPSPVFLSLGTTGNIAISGATGIPNLNFEVRLPLDI